MEERAISETHADELSELRSRLSRESDPAKKKEILARMLQHIQVRWENLFTLMSNEHNPERMLLMLAELDDLLETRRAQLEGRS